jgi:N utilization substance protein B
MHTDLAKEIIINESIELTKIYTNLDDEKQRKFNNKVIDQITKAIRG